MRHLIAYAALLGIAAPALASSSSYAECILSRMPGATSDVAASRVHDACVAEHPMGLLGAEQGAGRGKAPGFPSGPACIEAKGRDIDSHRGAQLIAAACRRLYDKTEMDRYLKR